MSNPIAPLLVKLSALDRLQPTLDEPDHVGAAGVPVWDPGGLHGVLAGGVEDGAGDVPGYRIHPHYIR